MFLFNVIFNVLIILNLSNCEYSENSEIGEYSEIFQSNVYIRQKKHFDWQKAAVTEEAEVTEPIPVPTTTTPKPIEKINVTSMIIRDGTVQINPDDVMHKEDAEGIGDVGIILWGEPKQKEEHEIVVKGNVMVIPTEHPSTTVSNLEKIMATMPSANEDVIRVLKLSEDEHYGKGKAKPKYISMALAHMNSTEYEPDTNVTMETMIMETHSEYSVSSS